MAHQNPSDDRLRVLLMEASVIAVVGASSSPDRPSFGVFQKLLAAGYRVVPVNPNETEVQGQKAYASLSDVPYPIDIVNVFRRPEVTPEVADAAVQARAKVLWLQSGIVNEDAARRAHEGGLTVVMDACIGVMHGVLRIPKKDRLTSGAGST
jgi:predicted CoA-binding protein